MQENRARLGENGRLVLPVQIRRAMGLESGADLALSLDEDGLHIRTQQQLIARAQAMVREVVAPGRSLVDELLAERRLEADREGSGG
jgi:AbrB family looped-hinge helix DNA binding protein